MINETPSGEKASCFDAIRRRICNDLHVAGLIGKVGHAASSNSIVRKEFHVFNPHHRASRKLALVCQPERESARAHCDQDRSPWLWPTTDAPNRGSERDEVGLSSSPRASMSAARTFMLSSTRVRTH